MGLSAGLPLLAFATDQGPPKLRAATYSHSQHIAAELTSDFAHGHSWRYVLATELVQLVVASGVAADVLQAILFDVLARRWGALCGRHVGTFLPATPWP